MLQPCSPKPQETDAGCCWLQEAFWHKGPLMLSQQCMYYGHRTQCDARGRGLPVPRGDTQTWSAWQELLAIGLSNSAYLSQFVFIHIAPVFGHCGPSCYTIFALTESCSSEKPRALHTWHEGLADLANSVLHRCSTCLLCRTQQSSDD